MSTTAREDDNMDETTAKIMVVAGERFDKGFTAGHAAGRDADPAEETTV
jgi:hypothetical protein